MAFAKGTYTMDNLLLLTDSYKVSHARQYPPSTETVYSFFESRGGQFKTSTFFGLQYMLKRYLSQPVLYRDIIEADAVYTKHFGTPLFNKEGWLSLFWKHKGRLPIRIKAVPEGTTVPTGNVLMTVENTDDEFPWLTNYLETLLSQVWYPTTVATQSREMKKLILAELVKGGDPAGIDFKLHDFGVRGSTSMESAAIGGAAHLINFKGTDNVPALMLAREYYGEDMAGFSIPASEHSTITSWGKDHEVDAFANMLRQYPNGLVACVSDSFDIYKACEELWGTALHDEVLKRNGTLVVRPDSGDPATVVLRVLDILGKKFGFTINSRGYKVLNPKVRVIQGDGINLQTLDDILVVMGIHQWSADNIAFGSGGGLLQNVNRDTAKFAFKCSAIKVAGAWRDVYKEPVTDPGKHSKKGRLRLAIDLSDGLYKTPTFEECPEAADQLKVVYENGHLVGEQTLTEIRQRSNEGLILQGEVQ